jgi:hypothetical protein
MKVQVYSLMWLRTTMNYHTSLAEKCHPPFTIQFQHLYKEDGANSVALNFLNYFFSNLLQTYL